MDYQNIITGLGFWFLIWYVVWGFFWVIMIPRKHDYYNNHLSTALYFLFFAACSFSFYFPFFAQFEIRAASLVVIITLFILLFFSFRFLYNSNQQSSKIVQKCIGQRFFILPHYKFLISKSFEILFQQVMFVSLAIFLHKHIPGLLLLFGILIVVYVVAHLPILKFFKKVVFGWYFTCASALAAVVFSFLILFAPDGPFLSYGLHWLFYLVSAAFLWNSSTAQKLIEN